ncbi:response regulator [Phaeodactylibacter xiamenensis]|jgi:CheY-like chemotaxis protein|uniref:response regulator n=1 Tax=Phaeodactylibacter xiamenensis TaxID=1524460 RepID=UPI0024A936E4|nr:response regulator [Phaeodactylibacter xiamenensis]
MVNKTKAHNILLIEDNPGDVRLTQEAFRESKNDIKLDVVTDGIEAIKYLRKEPPYESAPLPDLILLDLNLPKWDGREVLGVIKSDETLKRTPVVVLTTSNAGVDILKSYDLHANCFINKPIDFDKFFEIIHKIEDFWLSTTILPTKVS